VTTVDEFLLRIWRSSLTPDSLLSAEEAAQALPGANPDAIGWVAAQVRPVGSTAVYRWADVVAAMAGEGAPERTTPSGPVPDAPVEGYQDAASLLNTSATKLRRMVRTEGLPAELHPPNKSAGARNRRPWWTSAAECRTWYERLTTWLAVRLPTRKRSSRQRTHAAPSTSGPVDFAAHARKLAEGR